MVLQHNIAAMNSNRNLKVVTKRQSKSSEKLSSGYKINRAADDAAGLTISEGMRSMVRGLNRASDNAQDGYALLQTADGALEEIHSILQRGRELSVQAANDTNTDIDRAAIQAEIDELLGEVDRIAETTEFNTLKLLDGSKSSSSSTTPSIRQNAIATTHDGLQQFGPAIAKDPIRDSSVSKYQPVQLDSVEANLQSMVPKAVGAIMNQFSSTFQGNSNISNAIGVKLYEDNSTTLAYVACRYAYDSSGQILNMELNLSVNMQTLEFDAAGELTEQSRKALEGTIAHEMMHAFMDDALTNGMLGATNGIVDKSNQFPKWFKEGMAQTAAGGCSDYNDWVNGGLGLWPGTSESDISAVVKSSANRLSSGSTASQYGTGYLACMYLGYLAGGANAVTSQAIGNGLDKLLSEMKDGKSLSQAINDVSGGKYTSMNDFQSKFGDADSAHFISLLLNEAGATGSGSVIAPALNTVDVINAASPNGGYYQPDFTKEFTSSSSNPATTGGGSGGYNGSGQGLMLQIGSLAHQGMEISIDDAHRAALGLSDISVMSHEEASSALADFDYAINMVSNNRSNIGAFMNRLEHTVANLDNTSENTQAAESLLRDTDMAAEMVEYSASNILAQAGQSVLAQANQGTQGILQLLQ